jgi:hypothetical protein
VEERQALAVRRTSAGAAALALTARWGSVADAAVCVLVFFFFLPPKTVVVVVVSVGHVIRLTQRHDLFVFVVCLRTWPFLEATRVYVVLVSLCALRYSF